MEYHGKIGNIIGRIQHISLMTIIDICCTACRLANQTVVPNIPGFQGIKRCIQYLASNPYTPIFYHSNYYDWSNVIRLTWSGNHFEDYTTNIWLEFHNYAYRAIIINRRLSVSGIIYNLLVVAVFCKVNI